MYIALHVSPSRSYGASPAIMLPAIHHRRMCPVLIPTRYASARFSYAEGMEGWVDLGAWLYSAIVYLSAVSHPSK